MNPIETLKNMGDNAPRLCIIATGGGAGIQQRIWAVPGISNFFVGAMMPYDMRETARILGFTPTKFVSEDTAVDLAQTAYMLATLSENDMPLDGKASNHKVAKRALGIGVTCSATSTRKHRGEHRIVVAGFTENACYTINLIIPKGSFWDEDRIAAGKEPLHPAQLQGCIEAQRLKDGKLADELALYLLGAMVGGVQPNNFQCLCELLMGEPLPDIKIVPNMELAKSRVLAHPFFRVDGSRGTLEDIVPERTVFYPGAFNPRHAGHDGALDASMETQARLTTPRRVPIYSTTVNPPHKDPLTPAEMLQRAAMMRGQNFLLTEGDPLYLDKAKRFPDAYFVMGADALDRVLDPKWGVEPADLVRELASCGTMILVPGRLVDGKFLTCEEVLEKHGASSWDIDASFLIPDIFVGVDYRLDLSSTELRAKAA